MNEETRAKFCLAKFRGAIGDCTRKPGHDGFHQGAHGYAWTQEGEYLGKRPFTDDHPRI